MKFADIHAKVGHLEFTIERNARMLYDRILDEGVEHVLELGIAYGKATCYIAAALDELGRGRIDAVDLVSAKDFFDPCAEDLLKTVGLDAYVNIYRMQSGYTWFLHDAIKRATHEGVCEPQYDLAIIDGPKNWTIDGAAFFMTDKLLRQGGTLIFDDYAWTYSEAASRGRATTDGISHRSMSSEEMDLPQIHEVFELLVRQHPSYSDFEVYPHDDWAIARKTGEADLKTYEIRYLEQNRDVLVWMRHKLKDLVVKR